MPLRPQQLAHTPNNKDITVKSPCHRNQTDPMEYSWTGYFFL